VLTGGAAADILFGSPGTACSASCPTALADIMESGGLGESVDPGDIAFRELADGDLVNECVQVFDA